MAERKVTCPLCLRSRGGVHLDTCPRSAAARRKATAAAREAQPIIVKSWRSRKPDDSAPYPSLRCLGAYPDGKP